MDVTMSCERLAGQAHDLARLIEHLRAVGMDKVADQLALTERVLLDVRRDLLKQQRTAAPESLTP